MLVEHLRRVYRAALPLFYSRSRFRLFLNSSIESIDLRIGQLASIADHFSAMVRPIPIRAPFGESMLVVAPHQDDEAIGCGGALALQTRSGKQAFVVVLQDGGGEEAMSGLTREQLTQIRNEESRRAAKVVGLEPPAFLGCPDLASDAGSAGEQLREILISRKVDAVFVPFLLDAHVDHRLTNYILAAALESVDRDVRVFGYEVWGLSIPNVIVVIDEVVEQKREMLTAYEYANGTVDYVHSTLGLNMYHSRKLGAGMCRYAECFFEIPKREYISLAARVRRREQSQMAGGRA